MDASLMPLLLTLALVGPHEGEGRERAAADRILAARRAADPDGGLASELAALGPEALRELLELHRLGELSRGEERLVLSPAEVEALGQAIGAQPPEDVLSALRTSLDGEPDEGARTAALALLGRIGDATDLELAGLAAGPSPAVPVVPAVRREAYRRTLEGVLGREPEARALLTKLFVDGPDELRAAVARAAASVGALSELAAMLDVGDGWDALVLAELSRALPAARAPLDAGIRRMLRGRLEHADPRLRLLAVRACGRAGDEEALPLLFDLLEEDDADLRSAAARALRDVTRLPFGEDVGRWRSWHSEQSVWWEGEAQAHLRTLHEGIGPGVPAAVRALSGAGLHRDERALALADALACSDPDRVRAVGAGLRTLDSFAAVPRLHEHSRDPEPLVRAEARRTLRFLLDDAEPGARRVPRPTGPSRSKR